MWFVALLCFFVFAPSGPSQVAATTYTIYGTVRLPDGSPASRVVVQVNSQSSPPLQVFTNDLGRYEISNLPRGRYWLTATNNAAPDQFSDPIEIETGRLSPARMLINIYLRTGTTVESAKHGKIAAITLKEAVQHVPKPAQKALEQGLKHRSKKQFEKALESYNRSIDIFPTYFQAFAERGHLRIAMMQVEEAAADFARALELNDRYEPALRGSGICKFQQGRLEDAIKDFERAASEASNNAINHLFLGICNAQLDRRDTARVALRKALAIDPRGAVRAHVHLANLWIKENRPHEAVAELEAYLTAVPNSPDAEKLRTLAAQLQSQVLKK